jgi:hypothetical protein
MSTLKILKTINYKDILSKNYSLSPSFYKAINIKNKNKVLLKNLLNEELNNSFKGIEVGSFAYVPKSNYYFIRTKALQPHFFTLNEDEESIIPIMPKKFKSFSLREGDILILKDSNIGEVVILDKDLPNYMISGGIYKLPLKEKIKYYVFGFLKTKFFKEQLNALVSKGSTIKHAKTVFLDCYIPFPKKNLEKDTINYVSLLVKAIINKEKEIKKKHSLISQEIEKELNNTNKNFSFSFPTYQEVLKNNRLDVGLYSKEFKKIDYLIKNYKNGYFTIESKNISGGNTPKKRLFGEENQYPLKWITPSSISNYGTFIQLESINTPNKNNINENCVLIINRTSKGGRGEYVGISVFYDINIFGKGYHNQGIYKIKNYPDDIFHFIVAFLNSNIMRKYCSFLSVGSKMKEIKINQILQIPFPKFDEEKRKEIGKLYYNNIDYPNNLNLKNFLIEDSKWNNKAGIFQLAISIRKLKNTLNEIFYKIWNDELIEINFYQLK